MHGISYTATEAVCFFSDREHFLLSVSLSLIFASSLMLLIFVIFNLFLETKEIYWKGLRRWEQMSGDDKGQTGPMGGQRDGWGQEEGCLPSVFAAAASGTHFECWMSKKETPSLPEDGLEQQRGARRRWTFCDLLPECTWLCYAEVRMLLNHLFCPCNALMLLHSHTHSFCQRDDDDGQVKATVSCFLTFPSASSNGCDLGFYRVPKSRPFWWTPWEKT